MQFAAVVHVSVICKTRSQRCRLSSQAENNDAWTNLRRLFGTFHCTQERTSSHFCHRWWSDNHRLVSLAFDSSGKKTMFCFARPARIMTVFHVPASTRFGRTTEKEFHFYYHRIQSPTSILIVII